MVDLLQNKPHQVQDSFDFGWLIQNEQISDEEFCSYLVNETSQEIERLVIHFLKSPADQIAVVDQVIFSLLVRRRSFKNNISGNIWLYTLIFEECQKRIPLSMSFHGNKIRKMANEINPHLTGEAHFNHFFDSLTAMKRLIVILFYGQNLAVDEISNLLKVKLELVQTCVEQSQQTLMAHKRTCQECSSLHSNLKSIETALCEALQTQSPLIETAREDNIAWSASLLKRQQREILRRRTRKWVFRVAEFLLALLVLIFAEWSINQSWPFRQVIEQPTQILDNHVSAINPTLQPSPTTTPLPPSALIGPNKATAEILSLTLSSWARWKTIWADVQVLTYQVENFSDGSSSIPDKNFRKQIWLSLPGSSRVISGPSNGYPDSSYSISNSFMTSLNYDSGQMLESSSKHVIPDPYLRNMFSPLDIFPSGGQFNRIGIDVVAGRPAWVVDWRTNGHIAYRFWIDQTYGVILRRIEYAEGIFFPIKSDIIVKKIFFESNFSTRIFEPFDYKGDFFAQNFSGDPELIDFKSALKDWSGPSLSFSNSGIAAQANQDFSSSQLSFRKVQTGSMQGADTTEYELFAGQIHLGKFPLGGKSISTCERSPDGSWIAYNSPPEVGSGDTALVVANLTSIQSPRPALISGITAGDFSFSPDNRRLAFFGCEQTTDFCGIFLLDLDSWELTRLTPLTYADYIFWSPDGHSIALVGKEELKLAHKKLSTANIVMSELIALVHDWYFQVIDTKSGVKTYKRAFSWSNLDAPPDSPTLKWDIAFKIPNAGIQACMNPPEKVGGN